MSRAWFLNLDAEDELSHPGARTPSLATIDRCRRLTARLSGLVPEGDVAWTPGTENPPRSKGLLGKTWCPTPGALDTLRRAGARVPDAPPVTVLRNANHRAFAAGIAQPLPGATFVKTLAELEAVLGEASPTGVWLVKRALSYRGNGRRRVSRPLDDATRRWLHKALATGDGVQVEPEVSRLEDHGLHGFLARDGTVTWGVLTRQRIDERGQWLASERVPDTILDHHERDALDTIRERVVEALRTLGYWGPFGIDAFRWRDTTGAVHYNPLCEVNARYSMGWALGMAERRVDLLEL
jgi:hypothetical protein